MSSVDHLRQFVGERLTAAAEEIFGVFQRTIVQYEKEIERQRKLLDIVFKPEIKLRRIDLPLQPVCKEEQQQLWNQEGNSSLDQEEPEPQQVKEEQEEQCINRRGRGKETLVLTSTYKEKDQTEGQTDFPGEIKFPVLPLCNTAAVSEVNSELSNNSATTERQNQNTCKNKDSDPASDTGKELKNKSNCTPDNVKNPSVLRTGSNAGTRRFRCDTCGKEFKQKGNLQEHVRIHTGERPYTCKTCGKAFTKNYGLMLHIRTHTGEKPHVCKICGKGFSNSGGLTRHQRLHTGERPYLCNTCGKRFMAGSHLSVHIKRVHAGERSDVGTSAQKDSSKRRAHNGGL